MWLWISLGAIAVIASVTLYACIRIGSEADEVSSEVEGMNE